VVLEEYNIAGTRVPFLCNGSVEGLWAAGILE